MIYEHCMTMVGDASFDYKGQVCGIFPNSVYDIVVVLGDNEYKVVSFDELISLQINEKTFAGNHEVRLKCNIVEGH